MYVHVYILCNIYSAYICVYNAVFGGYHPVESAFQDGGEYRGKIRDGHSNPIHLVLKPSKTPKFLTKFSTVPCLPCTANMQNMHVNCKNSTHEPSNKT